LRQIVAGPVALFILPDFVAEEFVPRYQFSIDRLRRSRLSLRESMARFVLKQLRRPQANQRPAGRFKHRSAKEPQWTTKNLRRPCSADEWIALARLHTTRTW